jgi:maltose alpha-D-glucosyltransferase/alpha-amylase
MRDFRRLRAEAHDGLAPALLRAEQSNSSVRYGETFILKLFRRPCDGVNPELEIGRFLVEKARFPHVAPVAGALEYRVGRREPTTLATLHGRVPNEGDAWSYAIDSVDRYFDRVLAIGEEAPVPCPDLLSLILEEPSPLVLDLFGGDLEWARLLGRRVSELHRALASGTEDPAFAPETFGPLYERSLYQSMRTLATRVLQLLRDRVGEIPEPGRAEAERLLELEPRVLDETRRILSVRPLTGRRIRCHGDLHLGQVLYTGNDFVFIDFEGEPRRSIGERRIKHPPLRDVAGMLRSIDYAAQHALHCAGLESAMVRPEDVPRLEPWACLWRQWVSSAFLRAYLRAAEGSILLPESPDEARLLLRSLVLEKAIYELGYELESRPDWVRIPLRGILELIESSPES